MVYPRKINKDSRIGVTAPSDGHNKEVDFKRLDNAISNFKDRGLFVVETKSVRTSDKGRSADKATRVKELESLYLDNSIDAIIASSGGDFLVEILPHIDFNIIKDNPKWFQGFSDNTALSFVITTNYDIATIYSDNFSTFGMEEWHVSLCENIDVLMGEDYIQRSFDMYQDGYFERITGKEGFLLNERSYWRNLLYGNFEEDNISLEGRCLVACLDVLLNLVGTRFDKTKEFIEKYKNDGIIWCLESYNLSSEALTRGLWQLKEAGWFKYAKGFVFGRPAMFSSYTNTTYDEAVLSVLGEFNLPIILDADIGHKQPQFTMINGAIAKINSKFGLGNIVFERR